jgi:NTP pyrophosphatase (non-canonical NTP hydrolase)
LSAQCLKLGERVGELFRAVRKLQGQPQDPAGRVADIGGKAADVLILLVSIVNRCGISLEDAFRVRKPATSPASGCRKNRPTAPANGGPARPCVSIENKIVDLQLYRL